MLREFSVIQLFNYSVIPSTESIGRDRFLHCTNFAGAPFVTVEMTGGNTKKAGRKQHWFLLTHKKAGRKQHWFLLTHKKAGGKQL